MMATQVGTGAVIEDCLRNIGEEVNIRFDTFSYARRIAGQYNSGDYTYELTQNKVHLTYFYRPHTVVSKEILVTYDIDDNKEKLENDLRKCFSKLQKSLET